MIVLYSMKKALVSTLFLVFVFAPIIAQVGIGTTTPSAGSMLDITSADKGVLLPRVDIVDLATVAPIIGGATVGLLVYNTNTTTGVGYYYWDGSSWTALSDAAVNEDWELIGN